MLLRAEKTENLKNHFQTVTVLSKYHQVLRAQHRASVVQCIKEENGHEV